MTLGYGTGHGHKPSPGTDPPPESSPVYRRLLRVSTLVLPYTFYSLLGFLLLSLVLASRRAYRWVDPLTRGTLALAMGLLLLSSVVAYAGLAAPTMAQRPEVLLQLANFLPFFLLFVGLPALLRHADLTRRLQRDLVLASVPISVITLVEYVLKSPYLPAALQQWPWIEALRQAPHRGRPMVMFDHPNVLASYLLVVFGLAWGVLLRQWRYRHNATGRYRVIGALGIIALTLTAIACTGSRNALVVALLQAVIGLSVLGLRWYIKGAVLAVLASLGVGLAALSLGAARWSATALLQDPRVGLWKIALDLIGDRPWLGWGLGSFQRLYPSRLIDPTYLDIFHPHNIGLLLMAEAGMGVAIALTLVVSFVVYRCLRARAACLPKHQDLWLGSILAFVGVIGFSSFDVTLYDGRINALYWLVLACLYSATAWPRSPQPPAMGHPRKG